MPLLNLEAFNNVLPLRVNKSMNSYFVLFLSPTLNKKLKCKVN